jgi:hypothetical protein
MPQIPSSLFLLTLFDLQTPVFHHPVPLPASLYVILYIFPLRDALYVTMLLKGSAFWGIMPCSPAKPNRHFGEHVASIFRVDEYIKQETTMKQAGSRAVLP